VEGTKVGGSGRGRLFRCTAVVLFALSTTACTGASTSPHQKASGSTAMPTASSSSPIATLSPSEAPTPDPTIAPTPAPTFGPPGKFVPTGSMTVGRDAATATLLLDGRVLIAGGDSSDGYRSAELYDPKTGTFSNTGSMTVGRNYATARLLLDGRVLILGGWAYPNKNGQVESASAELYDPKTGTFSPTGSMAADHFSPAATRLLDGRVLIIGGNNANSAELYDPSAGTFSPAGNGTDALGSTATLLLDGRVLILGGDFPGFLYDPATGTFRKTGSTDTVDQDYVATRLSDGRVLVVGAALRGGITYPATELYDPATDTFSPTGSMIRECACSISESSVTAPLLADGRVLVPDVIFDVVQGTAIGSAELYDPVTGTFSQAGPMNRFRNSFTDTLLADGRVLFAGDEGVVFAMGVPSLSPAGIKANDADRASAELYVP
jgi:hypothetical protein